MLVVRSLAARTRCPGRRSRSPLPCGGSLKLPALACPLAAPGTSGTPYGPQPKVGLDPKIVSGASLRCLPTIEMYCERRLAVRNEPGVITVGAIPNPVLNEMISTRRTLDNSQTERNVAGEISSEHAEAL